MKKNSILFLVLISLVFSCTREFDMDVLARRQVMVNGLLIGDLPVIITLQYGYLPTDTTVIFLSNDTNLIENASVWLSDDQGQSVKLYFRKSINYPYIFYPLSGYYTDSLIPQAGHRYFLKIYVPGYDTIYSQTYVPYPPHVDSFSIQESNINYYYTKLLKLTILDSCGKDYYWLPVSQIRNYLFLDSLFNCQHHTFNIDISYFDIDSYFSIDSLLLFHRANEDFAKYIISLNKQYSSREINDLPNPFREPVIVYSNIINGVGIFAAVSSPVELNFNLKNK